MRKTIHTCTSLLLLSITIFFSCKKEFSYESGPVSQPPVVNAGTPAACAGQDQTLELPANTVTLDATCSTDPDKNIVGYTWVKISGPSSGLILTPLAVTTEVKDLVEGTYIFQLKVTDALGLFSYDTLKVTVRATINSSVDVYISGMANSQAVYWKNGVAVHLPSKSVEAMAHSIVVVGKDVYVAGEEGDLFMYGNNIAKYWKNGQEVLLTGPIGASATSIAVDGNDVYVAGWQYKGNKSIAKYWKNGQSVELSDGTNDAWATGISIVDGNVYVVGYDGNAARYWKNGQPITLSENGSAYGVAVSGGDVFVAGEEWGLALPGYATYWKNGKKFNLMQSSGRSVANSIAVEGEHVYVAGYEDVFNGTVYVSSKGRYWKDGKEVLLQGSVIVSSMAVFKEDVFVAGFHTNDASGARYWVNGKEVTLSGTWATGVFLVPR